MDYYLDVLKKYAEFNGRARRQEFWMFVLINMVIGFALSFIFGLLKLGFIANLYSLAVFLPSLAVGVRRLHDIGKSGWYWLVALIPFVGWIILIIWYCKEGDKGTNAYGDDVKS